jgi:hypothetical protein
MIALADDAPPPALGKLCMITAHVHHTTAMHVMQGMHVYYGWPAGPLSSDAAVVLHCRSLVATHLSGSAVKLAFHAKLHKAGQNSAIPLTETQASSHARFFALDTNQPVHYIGPSDSSCSSSS